MRTLTGCMALMGFGLLIASPSRGDEPQAGKKHEKLMEQMSGTWKIVAGANQGKKLRPEQLEGSRVMIEKNSIVVLDPDEKEMYKAKFQLDISTSPYKIDMISDMPQLPKSLAVGIVEFRKDGWRLCYGLPGADRPEKFASGKGSQVMLFSLAKVDTHRDDNVDVSPIRKETIKNRQQAIEKDATPE